MTLSGTVDATPLRSRLTSVDRHRIRARFSTNQASATEITMKMLAESVPPVPTVNGSSSVFMPKKPVTSDGGSRNAVISDRI